ncbi:MAG: hypothetical protein AB7O78_01720 [Thermoleophilia bacterium]
MTMTPQQIERLIASLRVSLDHLPATESRQEVEAEIADLRAQLRQPGHQNPERRGATPMTRSAR